MRSDLFEVIVIYATILTIGYLLLSTGLAALLWGADRLPSGVRQLHESHGWRAPNDTGKVKRTLMIGFGILVVLVAEGGLVYALASGRWIYPAFTLVPVAAHLAIVLCWSFLLVIWYRRPRNRES